MTSDNISRISVSCSLPKCIKLKMGRYGPMENRNLVDKYNLLYPRSHYYGDFKPEHVVFNANLQEFAHQVSYIAGLQTSGKLSSLQAYKDIKTLWRQLKQSKDALGIDSTPPADL